MNDTDALQRIKRKKLSLTARRSVLRALEAPPYKYTSILSWDTLGMKCNLSNALSKVIASSDADDLLYIHEEVSADLVNPVIDQILLKMVKSIFAEKFLEDLEVQNRDSGYSWIVALNKRIMHVMPEDITLLQENVFQEGRAPSPGEMREMREAIDGSGLVPADPAFMDYSRAARCGGFYNGFMFIVQEELGKSNWQGDEEEEYEDEEYEDEEEEDLRMQDAYAAALDYWERHGKKDIADPKAEPKTESVNVFEFEKAGEKEVLGVDIDDDVPKTYEDMTRSQDKEKWELAIDMGVSEMQRIKVLEEVPREEADEMLDSNWKFSKDADSGTYFADLNVCESGPSEYSSTCSPDTARFLLSLTVLEGLHVYALQLSKAFAYTPLPSPVYVKPPVGTKHRSSVAWKLSKVVSGMRNDSSLLFKRLCSIFKDGGLKQSDGDRCLFYAPEINVLVQESEMLVCTKAPAGIDRVKTLLSSGRYLVTCDENPPSFLGISLEYTNGAIKLTAKNTIEDFAKKYGFKQSSSPASLMDMSSAVLESESSLLEPEESARFRSMVGVLLYIARAVRFDITRAISKLGRYAKKPTEDHMKVLSRIVQYLLNTKTLGIVMSKETPVRAPGKLIGFKPRRDSGKYDFKVVCSADVDEKYMGYILLMNGNIIHYFSYNTPSIARSEDEALFVSMSTGTQDAEYHASLVEDRGEESGIIGLCGDSRSALSQYSTGMRTKMPMVILVHYNDVHKLITETKKCVPYLISRENNIARIMTTILGPEEHSKLLKKAMK